MLVLLTQLRLGQCEISVHIDLFVQHPAYKVGELGYMPACSTFGHDFEMDYPGTYTITIRAVEEQYSHWQPLVKTVNIQPSTQVAGIHACFHVSYAVCSGGKRG